MFLSKAFNLLQSITLDSQATTQVAEAVSDMATTTDASAVTWTSTILIYVVVLGGMYLLMFRPQKKREKELQELRESLRIGDNVVTAGGFYGKVISVESDRCVIEFGENKGVLIPVRRTDILPIREKMATETKEENKQVVIEDKTQDDDKGLKKKSWKK